MKRYIGLDLHAASTTFGVISETGKQLGSHVVETNGQALVEQLKTIPGKRHVVLEKLPALALTGETLSWVPNLLMHGLEALPVTCAA